MKKPIKTIKKNVKWIEANTDRIDGTTTAILVVLVFIAVLVFGIFLKITI